MPRCLDNYPWRSLKGYGELGPKVFEIGDFKNDVLKNGQPIQFRIIGFNHDKTAGGLVLPFTWEAVDCLQDCYPWNNRNTNQGSWGATEMRKEMNDQNGRIYRLMPDEIIAVAEPAIKLTADTYDGSNNIIQTEDKFWIKSEKETLGRCIYSAPGEGNWYEYYKHEDVPWYKMRNGQRGYTALRSPCLNSTYYMCLVYPDGSLYCSRANVSNGVAPAFSF